MKRLRIGLIGCGGMGTNHGKDVVGGDVRGAELTAICDVHPESLARARDVFGEQVRVFESSEALFNAKVVDAVIIATPHYQHPELAIEAFKHGLHVLIEKPAGAYTRQVRQMNEAAKAAGKDGKIFAIMFNQRTRPIHQKLKDLVVSGELGEIKRTNYIVTDWYRSQSYYDSGSWRGTWAGEGGGVLLNQCPHQLDLWQWICGMPKRVRAICGFGKYHDIEVEDDVTACVEYDNGATGVFIASTGETPGTNRFEIVGDRGKIVMEDGNIIFWRTRVSERRFNRQYKGHFGAPECWKCEILINGTVVEHRVVLQQWVDAIINGGPLVVRGEEGINSLELSSAMLLSTWTDQWVDIPVDEDLFYQKLQEQIEHSARLASST